MKKLLVGIVLTIALAACSHPRAVVPNPNDGGRLTVIECSTIRTC